MKLVPVAKILMPLAATAMLAACVTPPPRTVAVAGPPPQRLYVYPANGQTPEQTDRDRYECHVWAVQQTGVDPSRADANPYERVVVQPANPPGSGAVAGLIGGAIIGSILAGPRAAGAGLIIGATTGAVIGSAADANAQAQAAQSQAQINDSIEAAHARADTYRRAIGACLQGRGYTVT
jgi:predicted lipid-binding transport protein (Tim44 family)